MREPVDAPLGSRLRPVLIQTYPAIGTSMESAFRDGLPNDVLIVEDDPLIALDFEDTVLGFGVKTVRCAASVAHALAMIEERVPDFALLDVGLVKEKSLDVAARLAALNVPFAFVTGYSGDRVGKDFADRPRLPKPCTSDALLAVLVRFGRGKG